MRTQHTDIHPALQDHTNSRGHVDSLVDLAASNIVMVERDCGCSFRTATALVLSTMPKRVVVKWADMVLLNGPKASWNKERIIDEVTK